MCGDPGCSSTRPSTSGTPARTRTVSTAATRARVHVLNDSACNLASINLMKFVKADGEFDTVAYKACIRTLITAQRSSSTTRATRRRRSRRTASPTGRWAFLATRTRCAADVAWPAVRQRYRPRLCGGAHGADDRREALRAVGAYCAITVVRSRVTRRTASRSCASCASTATRCATSTRATCRPNTPRPRRRGTMRWNWVRANGYRNAQANPCSHRPGTIGFMMDCDTTGVEPDIALVKHKQLVGGGMMKIVNQTVLWRSRSWATRRPRSTPSSTTSTMHETIEGAPTHPTPTCRCSTVRSKAAKASAPFTKHGAHQDDGRDTAVHLRRDQQDRQRAEGKRPSTTSSRPTSSRGRSAPRRCPIHRDGSKRTQPLNTSKTASDTVSQAAAALVTQPIRQAARRAPRHHTQVRHPGARGLHHGGSVRERTAWRDLPRRGQGRVDDPASLTRSRRLSPTRCSTAMPLQALVDKPATCASSRAA